MNVLMVLLLFTPIDESTLSDRQKRILEGIAKGKTTVRYELVKTNIDLSKHEKCKFVYDKKEEILNINPDGKGHYKLTRENDKEFTIHYTEGYFFARIISGDMLYVIVPMGDNIHAIVLLDPSKFGDD